MRRSRLVDIEPLIRNAGTGKKLGRDTIDQHDIVERLSITRVNIIGTVLFFINRYFITCITNTKIQLKQDINLVKKRCSKISNWKTSRHTGCIYNIYIYGKCFYGNLPFECTKICQQRERENEYIKLFYIIRFRHAAFVKKYETKSKI